GFRPLTPNDIPLIGRDEKYKNLIYATGLGWLGITFAPAIGYIMNDLIINQKDNKNSDDILLFSGFYQ
ncbi:MAG: FAD-binding oxidoreductase, partial [Arcobacter sp.]|nr:FAD-binding oxidoreductase [Arcobacter sp.]